LKIAELKKVLKPLIKECIKEAIIEEGLLSNIVSEVAKGLHGISIVESKAQHSAPTIDTGEQEALLESKRQERIKKLNEHSRFQGVDLFEGTSQAVDSPQGYPLQGVAPNDAGVDISGIIGLAGKKWKNLV